LPPVQYFFITFLPARVLRRTSPHFIDDLGLFFFAAIPNQLNRFADDENQRRNADR